MREEFWSGGRGGVGYWLDGTFSAILGQIDVYHLSSMKTNDKAKHKKKWTGLASLITRMYRAPPKEETLSTGEV